MVLGSYETQFGSFLNVYVNKQLLLKLDIVKYKSRYDNFYTFLVENGDFWDIRGVGNFIRNIVLGPLLTLPLDPSTLYGLRTFYGTKIDTLVAK